MKRIGPSELILNPDGSVYHINLKPEHVADNIIFVGDPARVDKIARYFDHIEFSTQKREFRTVVGVLKNTSGVGGINFYSDGTAGKTISATVKTYGLRVDS